METDPIRMCELLVGLGEVEVLGVNDPGEGPLGVGIRTQTGKPLCPNCDGLVWSKGEAVVDLVDLPAFGRPVRLWWHKRRWLCPDRACRMGSFTEQDERIAPVRGLLSARAGRWATAQVGRSGRTVAEIARELGCDWHTVNKEVTRWGNALLEADTTRIRQVEALGVDETLFNRSGEWARRKWCTSVVDVQRGQLIDIVPGRDSKAATGWLKSQPPTWLWGDTLGSVGSVGSLPDRLRQDAPRRPPGSRPVPRDQVGQSSDWTRMRRRVQNKTLGHRGRKGDPLYRIRRLLTKAHERLNTRGETRLQGLLAAGDPYGEVRDAWYAKETIRDIYKIDSPTLADEFTWQLSQDLQDRSLPRETNRLGRTLARWHTQIVAWRHARVTNGPTEAINNLIKRIKRIAFGFRNFTNYRTRTLLYAGKPNWNLLSTVTPR